MNISRVIKLTPAVLVVMLGLTACGKKEEPSHVAVPPPKIPQIEAATPSPEAPPPEPEQATAATPPAVPWAVTADANNENSAPEKEKFEVVFNRMVMLSGEYYLEKKHALQSLDQLVAMGRVAAIPPAPTGKKYRIDPGNGRLSLVDK